MLVIWVVYIYIYVIVLCNSRQWFHSQNWFDLGLRWLTLDRLARCEESGCGFFPATKPWNCLGLSKFSKSNSRKEMSGKVRLWYSDFYLLFYLWYCIREPLMEIWNEQIKMLKTSLYLVAQVWLRHDSDIIQTSHVDLETSPDIFGGFLSYDHWEVPQIIQNSTIVWLLVWNMNSIFHSAGNYIIPTDEVHHFSEG